MGTVHCYLLLKGQISSRLNCYELQSRFGGKLVLLLPLGQVLKNNKPRVCAYPHDERREGREGEGTGEDEGGRGKGRKGEETISSPPINFGAG